MGSDHPGANISIRVSGCLFFIAFAKAWVMTMSPTHEGPMIKTRFDSDGDVNAGVLSSCLADFIEIRGDPVLHVLERLDIARTTQMIQIRLGKALIPVF